MAEWCARTRRGSKDRFWRRTNTPPTLLARQHPLSRRAGEGRPRWKHELFFDRRLHARACRRLLGGWRLGGWLCGGRLFSGGLLGGRLSAGCSAAGFSPAGGSPASFVWQPRANSPRLTNNSNNPSFFMGLPPHEMRTCPVFHCRTVLLRYLLRFDPERLYSRQRKSPKALVGLRKPTVPWQRLVIEHGLDERPKPLGAHGLLALWKGTGPRFRPSSVEDQRLSAENGPVPGGS